MVPPAISSYRVVLTIADRGGIRVLSAGCVIPGVACLPVNRPDNSRSARAIDIGWLADIPPKFNVYRPCQLQVKLIGTPSAPYVRRLGSVLGAKQISAALAYVEHEILSGGDFHFNSSKSNFTNFD